MNVTFMKLQGIYTALITPMRDLGHYFQVDEEKLRHLIQFQLEHHVHGLVVLGGTGEYTALSTKERVRAISIALDAVQGKLPVIAGVLETGFGECVEHCKRFQELGVDGLLVLPPFYLKPSQEGILDYFRRLDACVDVPLILYNIPYRTGVNILPETVEQILDHTTHVVGIKECCPDLEQNIELLCRVGHRISVLSGEEALFSSVMTYGAKGGMIATANVVPDVWVQLYNNAQEGKHEENGLLMQKYLPLIKALFQECNPGPMKYAMSCIGVDCGSPSTPILKEPTYQTKALISSLLEELQCI